MDLASDLRYALRSVRRHRGLTVVAVACMGVGIGVCTTLFNAVNPWLFRPLPYPDSLRLVGLRETSPLREGRPEEGDSLASAANYVDWRERSRSFESLGAFERSEANLATADEPERVHAARVTASLFPTLRIAPVLGRGFTRDEDEPGGRPVAILGHRLWQRRSAQRARRARRDAQARRRRPRGRGRDAAGLRLPGVRRGVDSLRLARAGAGRDARDLDVVARLADGVTVEQARSELGGIASALAREQPDANRGRGAEVKPLLDWLTPPGVVVGLKLLLAAGLFVQLIACANVANLLLAKAVAQRQEIAMRVALGAARGRLLRQFTVETLLVTTAGAALGLLAGTWGVRRRCSRPRCRLPSGSGSTSTSGPSSSWPRSRPRARSWSAWCRCCRPGPSTSWTASRRDRGVSRAVQRPGWGEGSSSPSWASRWSCWSAPLSWSRAS